MVLTEIGNIKENQKWMIRAIFSREKEVKSVANVTRRDVSEFLELASKMDIRPECQEFILEKASETPMELRNRQIGGAKTWRI